MDLQIVTDALTKIFRDIINFIPNLINGLIVLAVGYLIAWLVRWVLSGVLARLKFDPLIERTGVTGSLRGLGVKTPLSRIVGQTIFVLLLLSFLITATRLMGLEAVARLLEQLLDYLPRVIAALIVFLLGGVVAQFVGTVVRTAALASNLSYAARLGRLLQYVISVFVVVLALGQLGVDTAILVTAITITIAAFGLALGLALGLGARGVVAHLLAGFYLRQRLPAGRAVVVGDVRGTVGAVGGVSTLVNQADGAVVMPNAALLESIVALPAEPPAPAAPPHAAD